MTRLTTALKCAAALAVWWATAGAAHAQALQLACPAGAAAGTPATPLDLVTGPGWTLRYGGAGAWSAAYTAYRHSAWYNPTSGTWLTPGDPTPGDILTAQSYFYASPVIQVDGTRVDLSSITVTVQQAADNVYNATGILNSASPAGAMTAYAGASNFSALSAAFTPALTWTSGANQVLLQATNTEATHTLSTPTGVYAVLTINATCLAPLPQGAGAHAVPMNDPWALGLAALGLGALGARRLRRRRA